MFGNTNRPAFGAATNLFGQSAGTTTGLFGSRPAVSFNVGTSQPNTGGLFGTTTGATSNLFGTQQTTGATGLFGTQTQPAATTATPFGQPATSVGLFGTPAQAQRPLFGGATSTAFGTTNTSAGLFGTPAPTTNLFGTTTQAATTGGLFGQSPTGATGLFGTTTVMPNGTAAVKFNPVKAADTMMKNNMNQTIQTLHQCITGMKEYEPKSLEELRVDDYLAGRKYGTSGTGLFGAPAASTASSNLFGGGGGGTAFGSAGTSAGTSLFSSAAAAPAASTGGLFGQNVSRPLFGPTTTTTASTGFNFSGQPATTNLFGNTSVAAAQPATNLFGQPTTSVAQTGFGVPVASQPQQTGFGAPAGGFSFGATSQPAATNLFGAKTNLFGTTTTSAPSLFGQPAAPGFTGFSAAPATSSTNLFAPKTSTVAFPTFGAPVSSAAPFQTGFAGFNTPAAGNLFNTQQQQVKPLTFGTAQPAFGQTSTSFFGGTSVAPAFGTATGGNMFSNTGSSLFGGFNTQQPNQMQQQQLSIGMDPNAAAQQAMIQQQAVFALMNSPYGESNLLKNILPQVRRDAQVQPTDPLYQQRLMHNMTTSTLVGSITSSITSTISPRPLLRPASLLVNTSASNRSSNKSGMFDEDMNSSIAADTSGSSKRNLKKLVIKSKRSQPGGDQPNNSTNDSNHINLNLTNGYNWNDADRIRSTGTSQESSARRDSAPIFPRLNLSVAPDINSISPVVPDSSGGKDNFLLKPVASRPPISSSRVAQDDTMALLNGGRREVLDGSGEFVPVHDRTAEISSIQDRSVVLLEEPHPAGVVLTRPEYYTVPSLEALKDFVDANGNCYVPDGFTVGRHGYGSVFWPNSINVANINIDKIVHFRHKEVTVYPNESEKPPVGEELNREAEITLERVWPNDKSDHNPIKSPQRLQLMRYRERLEKITTEMGAKFIDYRPETGSWVFQVSHFSKYGLADEADEEGPTAAELALLQMSQSASERVQRAQVPRSPVQKPTEPVKSVPLGTVSHLQEPTVVVTGLGGEDFSMEEVAIDRSVSPSVLLFENHEMVEDQTAYEDECSQRIDQLISANLSAVEAVRQSFFDTSNNEVMDRSTTNEPIKSKKQTNLADVLQRSCHLLEKSARGNASFPSESLRNDLSIYTHFRATDKRLWAEQRPKVVRFPCVPPKYPPTQLPYKESLLWLRHRVGVDAGLQQNRRCRVGWGPEKVLFHIGKGIDVPKSPTERGKSSGKLDVVDRSYTISMEKIILTNDYTPEYLEAMLSCQLDGSDYDLTLTCPLFTPKPTLNTVEHYENLSSQLDDLPAYFHHVWSLCLALWGKLDKFADPDDAYKRPYEYQMARKEALSKWLIQVNNPVVNGLLKSKSRPTDHCQRILALLTARRIQDAATTALDNGDLRLSVLLGTLGGCVAAKSLMQKQLTQWLEVQADVHIEPERMKLFMLLAGIVCWELSNHRYVNVCQEIDWKRTFGLNLWYLCPSTASVAQAVESYEERFQPQPHLGHGLVAQPLPPYLEQDEKEFLRLTILTESQMKGVKWDLLYHLIKLSTDRSQRLEVLLNPQSHNPPQSSMDYHLSWHLWCGLNALGFSQIFESTLNRVHCDYAEQLVEAGLWHWALFVLCHIHNDNLRELHVKSVISRAVEAATEDQLTFVKEKLFIPEEWIFEAKALWAKRNGNPADQSWYCLKANLFNLAHQKFLSDVGPDAVANEDYATLRKYLEPMERHSDQISLWTIGGQIYWEYLRLCDQYEELKLKEDATPEDFSALRPILLSLASRLDGMNCPSPLHHLAQGEIGKRVAVFLRLLTGEAEWISLGEILARLPMPDDCFIQEVKRLALSIGVDGMTSEDSY